MKIVDLQSDNNRKAYQTPLLKSLGEVRELTRELEKGSEGPDSEESGSTYEYLGGGVG